MSINRAPLFLSPRLVHAAKPKEMELWDRTRCLLLAHSIEVAQSHAARNRGLLGRAELVPGHGLWIVPCRAIHTFGMRFAIDLIFLDRCHRIRKISHSVAAWRMSACWKAYSVIELASGTLACAQIETGDLVDFRPGAGKE